MTMTQMRAVALVECAMKKAHESIGMNSIEINHDGIRAEVCYEPGTQGAYCRCPFTLISYDLGNLTESVLMYIREHVLAIVNETLYQQNQNNNELPF